MLVVDLVNLQPLIADLATKYPQSVAIGTSEGIHAAGEQLADDVSAHTPTRTGKAAAYVRNRMAGKLTAIVDYDPREAFYMRFVLSGARAHPIFPKGRVGSRMAKRIGAQWRRSSIGLQRDWSTTEMGGDWSQFTGKGNQAKSLSFGGMARAHVMHPGIRPQRILTTRLLATQDKLAATVEAAVAFRLQVQKG